jgi:hypothetical protein
VMPAGGVERSGCRTGAQGAAERQRGRPSLRVELRPGGLGIESDRAPPLRPFSVARRVGRDFIITRALIYAGITEIMKELVATSLQL